jgi:phenylacetate-CoA ligase
MDVATTSRVLWLRRRLRRSEHFSEAELRAHQQRELLKLRQFASAHSQHYQRSHRGLERAPRSELPRPDQGDADGSLRQDQYR